MRYKAEEVRTWPQAQVAQGFTNQRAWLVEDGKLCGEAAQLLDVDGLKSAWEKDLIDAMTLPEALHLPWRSPEDLAPYVREAVQLAEQLKFVAEAALSKVSLDVGTT